MQLMALAICFSQDLFRKIGKFQKLLVKQIVSSVRSSFPHSYSNFILFQLEEGKASQSCRFLSLHILGWIGYRPLGSTGQFFQKFISLASCGVQSPSELLLHTFIYTIWWGIGEEQGILKFFLIFIESKTKSSCGTLLLQQPNLPVNLIQPGCTLTVFDVSYQRHESSSPECCLKTAMEKFRC